MVIYRKNQTHPPLPKKKRVDAMGNSRKRIWIKSGTSTTLLCKGVTDNGAKALISQIQDFAEKLGTKIECSFLITQ